MFIATTNYPERLDKRIMDRPSRFDRIIKIDMPSAKSRETYLKIKEPTLTKDELREWVMLSDGFSIAHMKEMIISNRLYGIPIKQVVKRLSVMKKTSSSSDNDAVIGLRPKMGGG